VAEGAAGFGRNTRQAAAEVGAADRWAGVAVVDN